MEKIFYIHYENALPFGIIIVTGPENIGWSICNEQDQFCKKLGKTIARGRARKYGFSIPHEYCHGRKHVKNDVKIVAQRLADMWEHLPEKWFEWFPIPKVSHET